MAVTATPVIIFRNSTFVPSFILNVAINAVCRAYRVTDAAFKFLELSEQYGFVVEGSVDNEKFTISISGESAENLYNDVKNKINNKVTELGLTIDNIVRIEKDKLKEMVAECYQEYSELEINELSEEKLLELIKQSRDETKNFNTIQERIKYYQERAEKVLSAKIAAINEYLNENNLTVIANTVGSAMNAAHTNISNAYATIKNQLTTVYSNIETQMNSYIDLKEEYLAKVEEYRTALENNASNKELLKSEMESLKNQANTAFNTLNTARENLTTDLLNLVETTIHNKLTTLNSAINGVLELIDISANEINSTINTAITNLKNDFINSSNSPWTQA